jgi:hypothetical protein
MLINGILAVVFICGAFFYGGYNKDDLEWEFYIPACLLIALCIMFFGAIVVPMVFVASVFVGLGAVVRMLVEARR